MQGSGQRFLEDAIVGIGNGYQSRHADVLVDGPVSTLAFHIAVEGTAAALIARHLGARPAAKAELRLVGVHIPRLRPLRRIKVHSHEIHIPVISSAIHAVIVVLVAFVVIRIVASPLLPIAATLVHLIVHAGISLLLIVVVIVVHVAAADIGFLLHKSFGFYGRINGFEYW